MFGIKHLLIAVFLMSGLFSFSQKKSEAEIMRNQVYSAFQSTQRDSVLKAVKLLKAVLNRAKKQNNDTICALDYNAMGILFTQMENYQVSIKYYKKSLELYKKSKRVDKYGVILSNMAQSYLYNKEYHNLKRTILEAKKNETQCDKVYMFHNYEYEIMMLYDLKKNDKLHNLCVKALQEIEACPKGKDNKKSIDEIVYKRLKVIYLLHDAFALINLKEYSKGYEILTQVEKMDPLHLLWDKSQLYENQDNLYYYKYRYFVEYDKNKDSAISNLLISHKYNKITIDKIREKASSSGHLIHAMVESEEKLKQEEEIHKREKKINEYLQLLVVSLSLLMLISFVFMTVTKRNNIKIKRINELIQEKNNELYKKNQLLLSNEKIRHRFFSVVSHEYRTPIYGIKGIVEMIKKGRLSENQVNSLIVLSNNAITTIDNAIIFSKIELKENNFIKEDKVKLLDLLNDVKQFYKEYAEERNVQIQISADFDISSYGVISSEQILRLSLRNIVNNAIKFSESNTIIKIHLFKQLKNDNSIELTFRVSNVSSIDEDKKDLLFEAFKHSSLNKDVSSETGIGLYITKYLLKKIDSKCRVSIDGKKVVFSFTIAVRYFEIVRDFQNKTQTLSILVVDDNKLNLVITKKNIESLFENILVDTVLSGAEAIDVITKKNFDLIFMDINMPDMDGYQTTEKIREEGCKVPVIALTALGAEELNKNKLETLMNGFVTKPYQNEELKKVIVKYA